jgi:hypothetical protein
MTLGIMVGRTGDDKDHFGRTPQANALPAPFAHTQA